MLTLILLLFQILAACAEEECLRATDMPSSAPSTLPPSPPWSAAPTLPYTHTRTFYSPGDEVCWIDSWYQHDQTCVRFSYEWMMSAVTAGRVKCPIDVSYLTYTYSETLLAPSYVTQWMWVDMTDATIPEGTPMTCHMTSMGIKNNCPGFNLKQEFYFEYKKVDPSMFTATKAEPAAKAWFQCQKDCLIKKPGDYNQCTPGPTLAPTRLPTPAPSQCDKFDIDPTVYNVIESVEGFVPTAYYDVGCTLTIGWGTTKIYYPDLAINSPPLTRTQARCFAEKKLREIQAKLIGKTCNWYPKADNVLLATAYNTYTGFNNLVAAHNSRNFYRFGMALVAIERSQKIKLPGRYAALLDYLQTYGEPIVQPDQCYWEPTDGCCLGNQIKSPRWMKCKLGGKKKTGSLYNCCLGNKKICS